ncbi:MAG: hypothetical protein HW421_1640 [Ignavibacteria bacterium]|nr:hypothetical protein [Ignavibacteria bacterium]
MELLLPQTIDIRVSQAASALGFNKQDIIERALLVYLDLINNQIELKTEFNNLDHLSDEALLNFEEHL